MPIDRPARITRSRLITKARAAILRAFPFWLHAGKRPHSGHRAHFLRIYLCIGRPRSIPFLQGIFMAVRFIEVPVDLPELDEADFAFDSQLDRHAPTEAVNLGAFRGLAYALAIEATAVGLGGLVWSLWRMLR